MKKMLFVGTFQSSRHQTKDVAESIALHLRQEGIQTDLTSFRDNKVLRLLDILTRIFFYSGGFIHINTFSDQAFMIAEWGSLVAKIRKKKIFFTLHGGKLNEFEQVNHTRVRKVLSRATKIMTPSLFLQSYFKQKGYDVEYVPNPLSLDKFPFKQSREREVVFKLLWVRAFGQIYQPELAIQTLFELKKKNLSVSLTMIGPDKGLLLSCKELAKNLGLIEDIQFVGPVSNDKLFEYYQSHHCYLNTPRYESFGVALMEAASCGIPIVSVRVGEIPYLWKHEESIRLVNDHKPESLASQVSFLESNPMKAQQQSWNAKKVAEQFDWKNIKPFWLKLLGIDT